MNPVDLAYIAGLIDGEGYIGIKKVKAYKCQNRVTPGYQERIQIRMVDEVAIKFIAETLGGWYYKEKPHCNNGRPLFCYQASDKTACDILKVLLPYLKVKRRQAELVLQLRTLKEDPNARSKINGYRKFPNRYGSVRIVPNKCISDENLAERERLWMECRRLNGLARDQL